MWRGTIVPVMAALMLSLTSCGGDGRPRPGPGQIDTIEVVGGRLLTSLAVSDDGTLYVAADDLIAVPPEGEGRLIFEASDFGRLTGIAAADGVIYVSEGSDGTIRAVRPTGGYVNVAGTGDADFPGEDTPAGQTSLNCPGRLAVDGRSDTLYVADGRRVRRIDKGGVISTVILLPPEEGDADDECDLRDGIVGLGFNSRSGEIVIARANTITRVDQQGRVTDTFGDAEFHIRDIAVDPRSGDLFVAESDAVRRVDSRRGTSTPVTGGGERRNSGDGGPAREAGVIGLEAIAFDRHGNLYLGVERPPAVRMVGAPVGER